MSAPSHLIFLQWNCVEHWGRVVILHHRCGDIICRSFLSCMNVEAEEHHSYGHHQDGESRGAFQSFHHMHILRLRSVITVLHGEIHSPLSSITYIYWKILITRVIAGIKSTCWHHCGKKKIKIYYKADEFSSLKSIQFCDIWIIIDSETNIWNKFKFLLNKFSSYKQTSKHLQNTKTS